MVMTFDSSLAKEYGLLESVLIQSIFSWVSKNKTNEMNFYDGRYWTYNSVNAFQEQFAFASKDQIWRALKKLEDKGVVFTGNYNANIHDRTKWYALSDSVYDYLSGVQYVHTSDDKPKQGVPETKQSNDRFVPPTLEEVEAYCNERNNNVDPEGFIAFYESKGWMVGKNKMKSWKGAVITFEKNQPGYVSKREQQKREESDKKKGLVHIDDWTKVDVNGNYHP